MSVLQKIGNGSGYLYVGNIADTQIISALENTLQNVPAFLKTASASRGVGAGQLGFGLVEVTSIDAAGGTLSSVTINGNNQLGSSVVYPGGTTTAGLATLIAAEINKTTSTGTDYWAIACENVVRVIPNLSTVDPDVNNHTIAVVDGSSTVYTLTDVDGAAGGTDAYGDWGYRFWIDEDESATATSKAGATEITRYVVNNDFNGVIPSSSVTISGGCATISRFGNIQFVNIDTEASAGTDDLDGIVGEFVDGDIIYLIGEAGARVVTAKDGVSNINLTNSTDWVSSDDSNVLALRYESANWYEVFRSENTVSTDATITGDGTSGSPLAVATPFPGFTDLPTDYSVTLATVATSGAYSDLTGTPSDVRQTTMLLSFETNEQGDMKFPMEVDCTVNKVTAYVAKAIAATDNATIDCKDNAAASMGVVTCTASAGIGTAFTLSPSSNNTFTAGDIMTMTTAKTTVGGKVLVTIKYTVS